jgi:hypothetical protein
VGELAELFSFVWVTAATATESGGSPQTESAVEAAVQNAERYVDAAIRKQEQEHVAAVSRAFDLAMSGSSGGAEAEAVAASAENGNAVVGPAMVAIGDVISEASQALQLGSARISAAGAGIPGPVPEVDLWRACRRSSTEDVHILLKDTRVGNAVDTLGSVIQVREAHHVPASRVTAKSRVSEAVCQLTGRSRLAPQSTLADLARAVTESRQSRVVSAHATVAAAAEPSPSAVDHIAQLQREVEVRGPRRGSGRDAPAALALWPHARCLRVLLCDRVACRVLAC